MKGEPASVRSTVLKRSVAVVLALSALGCHRVRNQLLVSPRGSENLYRCAQLELGRMGYAIVGADRDSGWLHAQKEKRDWIGDLRRAEIYVTVIPDEGGAGSHIQLTDNSYAKDDANELQQRCIAAASPEG